jgi:flagellar basal-body rod protein FlgG
MVRSLFSGASGMYAQQLNIDNISNNLANINTNGFKKASVQFQDLMYQTLQEAGSSTGDETAKPVELTVGVGVKPVATQKDFTQGTLTQTGGSLDLGINGDGFFQISMPDGTVNYTRDGSFKMSDDGKIITADGYSLEPALTLPTDTETVSIGTDGTVSVKLYGETSTQVVGQVELARFVNAAGLKSIGNNLYEQTPASGTPITGNPGTSDLGDVRQGYTEASNVSIVEEMVKMIIAQRAYETNSRTVRTADDMLQTATQLKR